ncbi:Nucleoside ABC transporter, periplasmic nucleoside-binding protein [Olavius algarvensis spirochete endosymbiont]|uniref:BMP family lipoprotein n=1 Tax=Olavius algarvensis spirochete endosymbiont TaxID=260710 RepID=UPI000F1436B8|nr:BMP family ABC transporter substrate-binding protein [Olavius algarvensis spirochete endosymbiont]VDA99728.1 Nucleoside ABC transporter, periplasmic nucleoside-binding protein [Olavius algarvensis spirochete endosymbiont]
MRKLTVIFLLSIPAIALSGAGSKAVGTAVQERIIVGMATDANGLGDGSFNDGVYAGLKKAEDEGLIEIRLIEPASMTDYVPNLSGLAEDGAELIFAVGFLFYDALLEVAPNYPDTMFAGIDLFYDSPMPPSNVLGINWKEHESGYLAGVVAGLMTREYANRSDKLNDENVIGAVLGMDIPPVERYFVGFTEGAKSVNSDIEVLSVVTGTFTDQAKGKEATIALAEQGADIVIQFAGLTGMGIFTAAQEKNILVMGADVDQNHFAPEYTLTSAMKGTTQATYLTTLDFIDGNFKGGGNAVFGLAEDAVGLAPFHDFDFVVPSEVIDAVEQARSDIISGAVDIPQTRDDAGI